MLNKPHQTLANIGQTIDPPGRQPAVASANSRSLCRRAAMLLHSRKIRVPGGSPWWLPRSMNNIAGAMLDDYPGLFMKPETKVPPSAFKVLIVKHLKPHTEASNGRAECFSAGV
jgi:hypothetical protein